MSVSYIPEQVKVRLWGKAGGRCEYRGCNKPLWLDSLTQAEFNTSYIAHIIADQPSGPRGDAKLSKALKKDLSNLMLMCDTHHRLIDHGDVVGHPVALLEGMKAEHETRIELLTGISIERQSHVVLYGANIGAHGSPLSFHEAARGMFPDRYPASANHISIGLGNSSFEDCNSDYWQQETAQIRNVIQQQIRPRIKSGEISHLSVFALAPQPLLIFLGAELSDIPFAEVYQRRKEPCSWTWEPEPGSFEFSVTEPESAFAGDAALVLALSATIHDARVTPILGNDIAIWRITIPDPHNDFVRSKAQAESFRKTMRRVLDQIKAKHGQTAVIHVFPAMPVSLAVDFGRVLNRKADLSLVVYDENRKLGGFVRALEIGSQLMVSPSG